MNRSKRLGLTLALAGLLLSTANAEAGGKIAIDDTKWISIGAAARADFSTIEDAAPSSDEWSSDFNLQSARIYVNGQIHEKIKFELNTECRRRHCFSVLSTNNIPSSRSLVRR